MNKNLKIICIVLVISIVAGFMVLSGNGKGTSAQESAAPAATKAAEAQSSGWQKRCVDDSEKQCEIFQIIGVGTKEKAMRLSEVAVSLRDDNVIMLGATLPLGITLLQGVGLQIDDGKMMQMPFKTCNTLGCIAISKITPDVLTDMKNGGILNVYFFDGANKKIKVQLTLVGFTKAIQSL